MDDPQSRKSLAQTDEMVEIFRQDWLSRPGSKGTTVVLMTRQGEHDFAEVLINEAIVDHHIVLPAWSDSKGWLWPERYTEDEYAIMRRNAGELAWERNYMQIARSASSIIFNKETIAKGRNPMRSINDRVMSGDQVNLSIDPGYNVTGYAAALFGQAKLQILDAHKHFQVAGTEGIIQIIEDACTRYAGDGAQIANLIIETKAFQKGLATDQRIMELQRRFGFNIVPHDTGMNKYDPDLGVPQIVHSLNREEIEWPWADDATTRQMLTMVEDDMYRWRPGKKGNQLEQDALMAVWFLFLHWKLWRVVGEADPASWSRSGSDRLWFPGQEAV